MEFFNSKICKLSDIVYYSNRWVDSLIVRDGATLTVDTTFNTNYLLLKKGNLIVNKALKSAIKINADSSNSITGTKTLTSLKDFAINSGTTTFGVNLTTNSLTISGDGSLITDGTPTLTVKQ